MVAAELSAFHKAFRLDRWSGNFGSNPGEMVGQALWHRAVAISHYSRRRIFSFYVRNSKR